MRIKYYHLWTAVAGLIVFNPSLLLAQIELPIRSIKQKSSHYQLWETGSIRPTETYLLSFDKPLTSIAFQSDLKIPKENGARVFADNDTIPIRLGSDVTDSLSGYLSSLLIFKRPIKQLTFYSGSLDGPFLVHGFNDLHQRPIFSGGHPKRFEDVCELPESVSQSEWRRGLSSPQYSRSFHSVNHLIVHHSATSNASTDFMAVVRNIYLFHTETNGWSDIGYNYLIAPDGTLFLGRDPGVSGEQDNVRGAHFCGANTGTMGVCVLGNYEEAAPNELAISTLEKLLAWKVEKSGLNPLGTASHSTSSRLPVIAGHRQGCSTLCPGGQLFTQLPRIRERVNGLLTDCQEELPIVTVSEDLLYPNPATEGKVFIEYARMSEVRWVYVLDALGKRVPFRLFRFDDEQGILELEKPAAGTYLINLVLADDVHRKWIMFR